MKTTLVLLAALSQAQLAQAQIVSAASEYPNKPIRIVVPVGAGGGNSIDLSARLLARGLSKSFAQQVVVENRPGAASIIGNEVVAKAPADGYTLLVSLVTLAINPATYKKVPYDAMRDFAPITRIMSAPLLLVLHPSVSAASIQELIKLAKAKPGEIIYGSAGYGSIPHLAVELFASMAKIRLVHVPYSKGPAAAFFDLLAGRIVLMTTSISPLIISHVREGKLRVLGITTATRSKVLPDVPTIAESGLPGYEAVQWAGFLAPAGTPREIISRLHQEAVAVLHTPEVTESFAGIGAEVITSSPEAFGEFIKTETVKWARVVKEAGIQPQ